MKKVVTLAIPTLVLYAVFLLTSKIYKRIEEQAAFKKNTEMLPHFSFRKSSNTQFSDSDLVNTENRVIINYFNPECEHCQYMASSYVKNARKLGNISLLMVTVADDGSISKFKTDFHLDSLQNLVVVRDDKFRFSKIFGTTVVPSFFIYKDRKLVRKIIGETKIENLLK